MTREETGEVDMQDRLAIFFGEKRDIFGKYKRLNDEIVKFTELRLLLKPLIAKQSEITTGITGNKKSAFTDLISQVVKIAGKALFYANDTNNQALAAVFTVTTSSMKYQTQAKQLIKAQAVADALTANADALVAYNISAADIASITDGIIACKSHVIAPSVASSNKKAATTAIKNTLIAINACLTDIDRGITMEYSVSNPDLVIEYNNYRKVDTKGIRHTGITVTFTDAATGKPVEGAVVTIASLNKTAISNINGEAEIEKMKTGTYHITFSATNYAPQLQDVVVPRSRKVDIAIALVAIP